MIEFLCPNGHKIRCPAEQAGRAAKCPRCGVKFLIPQPSDQNVAAVSASDSVGSATKLTESPPAGSSPGSREPAVETERQIEFLCPNGHHLHGPTSLQGRAGECPECGSRFRIPVVNETPSEQPGEEIRLEQSAGEGPGGTSEAPAGSEPGDFLSQEGFTEEPLDVNEILPDGPGESSARPGATDRAHSLRVIFTKLWAARGDGVKIELQLAGGDVLAPDGFVAPWSQRTHAVFAVKEQNKSYSLTVVAWDAIERVRVRGLKQLPAGTNE